ncbi:MAG: TlpA family protein disulfide reductase [Chloroflexota bacterium]|nr:TlpA family protein disulfide reductase [Chloroflexota bacterium]
MPDYGPGQQPTDDDLPEPEAAAHGRVGYGRYGKYTPLVLALLMILGLAVIGWLQWRAPAEDPTRRPGQLPGTAAPDVSLTLLDGTSLALTDLRGSVVVLNFWASWCEPCRAEMPLLQAVHDGTRVTGEATAVLGVGIRTDHDADARAFVDQLGLTYPIGRDTDTDAPGIGPIEHAFGIQGAYPSTIIIRPDGAVDRLLLGEVTADQLRFAIDEARANSGPVTSGAALSNGKKLVAGYR